MELFSTKAFVLGAAVIGLYVIQRFLQFRRVLQSIQCVFPPFSISKDCVDQVALDTIQVVDTC